MLLKPPSPARSQPKPLWSSKNQGARHQGRRHPAERGAAILAARRHRSRGRRRPRSEARCRCGIRAAARRATGRCRRSSSRTPASCDMCPTRRRSSSGAEPAAKNSIGSSPDVIGIIDSRSRNSDAINCAGAAEEASSVTQPKGRTAAVGATMAEVAALAGVTKMTVSRVLRQPEKVHADTRARVAEAMAALGYVPNRLAGSLTAGTSGLVAAIVPTLRHSLFADTLEGLSDVLAAAGLGLIVSSSALSHRRRGEPDPLHPRAPARRAGADRAHPHRRGARPAAQLRHPGGRDLGDRRRADRHGGRLFQPRGGPCDDGGADPLRLPPDRLRQRPGREQRARPPSRRGLSRGDARGRARGARRSMSCTTRRRSCRRPARRRCGRSAPAMPAIDAVFFTSDVFAVGAILACRELGIAVPRRDRHRRLPRSRDRPRRLAGADHRACAGAGDRPQGRAR